MIEIQSLIYNFNEHGLYYDYVSSNSQNRKLITLSIDTIQLEIDYDTKEILMITGFIPLINAGTISINEQKYDEQKFLVPVKNIEYSEGISYDYCDIFPESSNYFLKNEVVMTFYDKINKVILIGTTEAADKHIRVNKNIICGLDEKGNLQYLQITPDIVI